MIGADLEGADLESRAAGWAASVISDDAAAVRTVIEAYGDRPTAANLVGVVSQCTGNAAVMKPGLETVVESQQFAATYDAFENMRLDFVHTTALWEQMNTGLREVTGGPKRVGTSR